MRANGCELSGRGSLPHNVFQELASPLSLASAAESPVRSSEGLGMTQLLLEQRIQTTRLLTPPKHKPREFGEDPRSRRPLGGTLRRCRPVHDENPPFIAEKPPFMAKSCHSWTTATSRECGVLIRPRRASSYLLSLGRSRILPNGLELSGRGSLPHILFQELGSRFPLASAAASPVRSSEGLGRIIHPH